MDTTKEELRPKELQPVIDFIYDMTDSMMKEGEFGLLNKCFEYIKPYENLHPEIIMSWLVSTLPVKSRLPKRDDLVKHARTIFSEEEMVNL